MAVAFQPAMTSAEGGTVSVRSILVVLTTALLVSCGTSDESNVVAEASLASSAEQTLGASTLAIEMELETTEILEGEGRRRGEPFESRSTVRIDRVGDRTDGTLESTLVGNTRFWTKGDRTAIDTSRGLVDYIPGTTTTSIVDDIDLMTDILATSPSEVISEDADQLVYALDCGDRAGELQGSLYAVVCHPEVSATVTIDRASNRLLSIHHEGPYPLAPGFIVLASGTITYNAEASIDNDAPFDSSDSGPLTCVARSLDLTIDDIPAIVDRVAANTTGENGELFGQCGFEIYPPGKDLYEIDG